MSNNVPKNMHISLVHLHSGNSSRNKRKGHPYVSIAKVVDNKTGNVLAIGKAYCSRKDQPSRSIGRTLATYRALHNAGVF